jgi:hypothetical protein
MINNYMAIRGEIHKALLSHFYQLA